MANNKLTSHEIREKLLNITECSICTDTVRDPRILPCVHTFCLECIKRSTKGLQPGRESKCPLCRTLFKIPPGGVESLSKNFFVEQLKDITNSSGGECDACASNKPVSMYCLNCPGFLCETCVRNHKGAKLTHVHRLVKPDDENISKANKKFCSKHEDRVIELYCIRCKMAMCMICFAEMHKSHDCCDINKIANDRRAQLSVRVEDVVETVSKCKAFAENLRTNDANFKQNVKQIEKQINDQTERLKRQIDDDRRKLLGELASREEDRKKVMDNLIQSVEQHISLLDSFVDYTDELRRKGTATDIVEQTDSLLVRAAELVRLDAMKQSMENTGSVCLSLGVSTWPGTSVENVIGKINKKRGPNLLDVCKANDRLVKRSAFTKAGSPSITHIIPADGNRKVVGVTSINNQLFVLRKPSRQQIEVYDTKTFTYERKVRVDGLSDDDFNSLASCIINKCLYVGDLYSKTVNKVELARGDKLSKWKVGSRPSGLSVNTACNVLVTCYDEDKILEYTTGGQLLREIKLQKSIDDKRMHLMHSIELTGGQFVICRWNPLPGDVIVFDKEGRVVVSYKNNKQSTDQLMKNPTHLAVDKNDRILVADTYNNRVLMLNSSLSRARALPVTLDGELNGPHCLHFDESRGRLLIGEYEGKRVVVIDNIWSFSGDFK